SLFFRGMMMQQMGGCAIKRGFFTLRDCGNQAMNTCQHCLRPVCGEHSVMRVPALFCVDCNARQQQTLEAERVDAFSADDTRSLYTYRHSYYTHSHYQPFYTGYYYSNYYDTYDARPFNRRDMGGDFDAEDGTDSSFWAS